MPRLTTEEFQFNQTRHINILCDGAPAIGLQLKPGGIVVAGRWLEDGRWVTLYTHIPTEDPEQAAYRADILAMGLPLDP